MIPAIYLLPATTFGLVVGLLCGLLIGAALSRPERKQPAGGVRAGDME